MFVSIRELAGATQGLGIHREALRNWARQVEAEAGECDDRLNTTEPEKLRRLREENAELKRANDILKAARVDSTVSATPH
ncbi:transposase [Allosalinactinospora lopnorensis]|uniref:transposase n=1 Tax=Allosalinactinospora lopnorensis TaxID=1352348 RepID=UPI000623DDBE|nr:transposase [Allosalinactinospora lopnorensis]